MPTVEERLAALETKLAALTDTTPTNYYEHQYSGEEIDNAVARALPNGAIDQAAGTFVRPNLLDNWYFGRPVDQRKGYIQIAGTMMYKDAACTDQFGPSAGTTPVVVYATYARPIDKGVELALYIPLSSIVRGYTGQFVYAIDRWFLGGEPSNVMEITDGGIHVSYTKPGWNVIQKFKNVLRKGNTYTFSAVYKSTLPVRLVVTWGNGKYFFNESSPATSEWALVTITGTVPNNAEIAYEQVALQPLGSVAGTLDIKAAKLELGPTQTLAHQENGQWVLNEVPEEGEQLRRGQWYFWRFSPPQYVAGAIAFGIDANTARAIIYLPEQMRTSPTLNLNASSGFFLTGASGDIFNVTVSSVWTNQNSVYVDFKKSGAFEVNAPYFVRGGASSNIDISADL